MRPLFLFVFYMNIIIINQYLITLFCNDFVIGF